METYVVDAHSLVWFIAEDERLSLNAKQILEQAEEAKVQVLIPTVVLAEITHISRKKRVSITIDEVLDRINQSSGFVIVPFDFPIFQTMLKLPKEWELHDLIIGATTRYYRSKLITKDSVLQNSLEIEIIW
jgi:PIN domain nuclease of toxin-antitoxin system